VQFFIGYHQKKINKIVNRITRIQGSKKYKNLNDEEIETMTAEIINDTFQGINWERLMSSDSAFGRNLSRQTMRVLRIMLFGSDRFLSVTNRVVKVFTDRDSRWIYLKLLLRSMFYAFFVTNVLQLVFTSRFTWDNKRGNWLDLELPFLKDLKGNPLAINLLGTSSQWARFVLQPTSYIDNKGSPVMKMYDIIRGKNSQWNSQSLVGSVFEVLSPVPFGIRNILSVNSKKPKTGDTEIRIKLARGVLEFLGMPTTYRSRNRRAKANLIDVFQSRPSRRLQTINAWAQGSIINRNN
jgi:hypothetical protein